MITDPVLFNDWHPVASLDQLQEKPLLGVRLLGEDLVIWRGNEGTHVWQDLCIHRGSKLSKGKHNGHYIACPYHGWEYGEAGTCIRIPAHPGQTPPAKARVKPYLAQERYGLVWVCLGEPTNDPPPYPHWQDERFAKAVCDPCLHVRAHGPRLIENFLDAAHFPYVHEGVLGAPNRPEIGDYEAHITPNGVESDPVEVYQPSPFADKSGTVHYLYYAFRPLTAYLVKHSGSTTNALMMTICPHDQLDSSVWFVVATTAVADSAELKRTYSPRIHAIFEEDRAIVEDQRPELLPLDLQAELHLRSDRMAIAYRKWLGQLGLSFGTA